MRHTTLVAWFALLAAGSLLTACSLRAVKPHAPEDRAESVRGTTLRVAQVGYGRDARFTRCVDAECPRATPKQLASWPSPVADARIKAVLPASPAIEALPIADTTQPVSVAQMPRGADLRKVVLHFAANSAQLTAAHKALLSDALDGLVQSDRIVIQGRTDSLGSEPHNQALALARGLAVRHYLLDLAPTLPGRISIDAKGRCCYAAPNDTGPGRALNRRVELVYATRLEVAL